MWVSNYKKENNAFYSIFKAKYIKIDLARVLIVCASNVISLHFKSRTKKARRERRLMQINILRIMLKPKSIGKMQDFASS